MTLHKSPDSPLSWLNALTASKPANGPILQFRQKFAATGSQSECSEAVLNQSETLVGRSRRSEEADWEKWVRVAHQGSGRDDNFSPIFNFQNEFFWTSRFCFVRKSISKLGWKVCLMVCPSPVWNWITGDSCRAALCYNQPIQGESRPKMGSSAAH